MKRNITYISILILSAFLITWYASNYYSEDIKNISDNELQGKWNCKLSMGYREGSLNIGYEFNNNTFKSLYKLIVIGDLTKEYAFDVSGKYQIEGNTITLYSDKINFIKDDGTLYNKLNKLEKDDKEMLIILKLNKSKLEYTIDKNSKYICNRN